MNSNFDAKMCKGWLVKFDKMLATDITLYFGCFISSTLLILVFYCLSLNRMLLQSYWCMKKLGKKNKNQKSLIWTDWAMFPHSNQTDPVHCWSLNKPLIQRIPPSVQEKCCTLTKAYNHCITSAEIFWISKMNDHMNKKFNDIFKHFNLH